MKQIFDIELIMCRLATCNVKLKREDLDTKNKDTKNGFSGRIKSCLPTFLSLVFYPLFDGGEITCGKRE